MTRSPSSAALIVLAAAVLIYAALPGDAAQQPSAPRLAGARPSIDASGFPSLQAALDALPAEGGLVRLPAGTFEINEPLRITQGDVCLEGCGSATHIKNVNQQGQPAILLASAERQEQSGRRNELWRIRLSNFRVTGNESSGSGIMANGVNEIHVDGVTVSYHGGDGIRLDHCYEDPRISDCLITYNKAVGVNLLGCHDIVVSACQFEENRDALHCADGFNLCMTGCCVDDHLGRGVVIENTYGSVVSGNMIEECAAAAIVLDRDCYGTTLSANVIAHNGAGIDLRDAHGCAVSANTFTIMKTAALRIGPASGRIAVTGNNFSDSYLGEGKRRRAEGDRAAAGLLLDGATVRAVVGNVFSGLSTPAVALGEQPSAGIWFHENVVVESEMPDVDLERSSFESNLPAGARGSR